MLHYKNILLATDLSECCEEVAEKAADLARKSRASLSIIHVIEHSPMAYGGEFSIPIDANLEQTLEKHAREGLTDLAQKHNIPEQNQYITSGSVKLSVIDLADEIKADLIVVGTHSHHGIDRLLGSRANAILHHAKCDVWVVHVKEEE